MLDILFRAACDVTRVDCRAAVIAPSNYGGSTSTRMTSSTPVFAFNISAICELLRERDSHLVKINREVNGLAHELSKIGRVKHRTEFWLSGFPQDVSEAVAYDCNSMAN
jgi:hypothetical protein